MVTNIIVARSPEGKVTTINGHVGPKGVPYGWQFVYTTKENLPTSRKLVDSWEEVSQNKKIFVSAFGLSPLRVEEEARKDFVNEKINSLKAVRARLLSTLDVEFLRAIETKDKKRQRGVVSFKNALRNLSFDFEGKTDEEIMDLWYKEFDATVEDYMPRSWTRFYVAFAIFAVTTASYTAWMLTG